MALTYDIVNGTHRDAQTEWAPHDSTAKDYLEWHYYTANLVGDNGHRYFLFLCAFDFQGEDNHKGTPLRSPKGKTVYVNMFMFKDYDEGTNLFGIFPVTTKVDKAFDQEENALKLSTLFGLYNVYFQYQGDNVNIRSKNSAFRCDLKCTGGKRVMWMKDSLGINGFIREGGENDRSFYYSLPELPTTGTVTYKDRSGKKQTVRMTGEGWIDRQWGEYANSKSWDWMSFRFTDGDRINTYSFYNGYQVGVLQRRDGSMEYFSDFEVTPTGYCRSPKLKTQISWGWEYEMPVKEGYYKIVPLSNDTFSEGAGNTFFEGTCRIFNKAGEMVGWAIAESMGTEIMHNGPDEIAARKQAAGKA